MMRLVMPLILIGISVAVFFVLTNPIYNDVKDLRVQVASYDEALSNSKALENERDKLTAKYNSIDRDNLIKIQKLLPENIDNIRLILEIEQIALPYGMALKNIKYNSTETDNASATRTNGGTSVQGGGSTPASPKDYGVWDLEFSATGTYSNFLNFTRDLESNLRIVDVSSIQFSSGEVSESGSASGSPSAQVYDYSFKIKTYWLKN